MDKQVIIMETANKAEAFKALKEIKEIKVKVGKTKTGINFKKLCHIIVLF